MPISQELLHDIQSGKIQEECLSLCNAELNDDDIIKLTKALKRNKKITELALKSNLIGDKGIQALASLNHLTALDLTDNCITPIGAEDLAKSKNPLTDLNLSANRRLGNDGAIAISKTKNKTLKKLSMGCCEIGNGGACALLRNTIFEDLDISANNIGDAGLKGLKENENLVILELSQNNIRAAGAQIIADNNHLKNVSLDSNSVGDEGAKFLAKNQSIIELDLSHNKISEEGFLALCQNPFIQKLYLSSNRISFSHAEPLPKTLESELRELNLGSNKIEDSPEEPLRSFLIAFPKLKKLSVLNNEIGERGALIFSQFKKNLEELNLSGRKVPVELRSFSF